MKARRGSPTFPPLASTLEVLLVPEDGGTRVDINHWGLPETEAARHAQGWTHYLARLQNPGSGREPEPHVTPVQLTAGAD